MAKHLICPNCGLGFEPKHHRAQFCRPACSKAYNNRQLSEGQRVVALAKAWRLGRNAKGKDAKSVALRAAATEAFGQLCRELDALNAADHEAGRMHALKLYRQRKAAGLLDFSGAINRIH